MKKYGLVGRNLSYSHSKIIHEHLIGCFNINATYDLIEVEKIDKSLLDEYDGLNITIPFKEDVTKFLNSNESRINACNTILNYRGLHGYNTDFDGFNLLVRKLNLKNIESVIILGDGASSKMVQSYFKNKKVTVISRKDEIFNYDLLPELKADILVNTTPIGMKEFNTQIKEEFINNYQGIIDLNYNPQNSKLSLMSKKNNVKFINGLYMLIKQAISSFEIWHNVNVYNSIIEDIYLKICLNSKPKIALIGMPLSGKTTFIKKYHGVDLDFEIIKKTNKSIEQLFEENMFRLEETNTLQMLVNDNTPLIALGGGAILDPNNIFILKDYLLIYLNVSLDILLLRSEQSPRPLIKSPEDLKKLYYERIDLYKKYANVITHSKKLEEVLDEITNNQWS